MDQCPSARSQILEGLVESRARQPQRPYAVACPVVVLVEVTTHEKRSATTLRSDTHCLGTNMLRATDTGAGAGHR